MFASAKFANFLAQSYTFKILSFYICLLFLYIVFLHDIYIHNSFVERNSSNMELCKRVCYVTSMDY